MKLIYDTPAKQQALQEMFLQAERNALRVFQMLEDAKCHDDVIQPARTNLQRIRNFIRLVATWPTFIEIDTADDIFSIAEIALFDDEFFETLSSELKGESC